MTNFLDKCEEYFETRDFYEILKIERDASDKELKKAYHRLSLLVHPDRVEESKKLEATEKFKVLGKIHSILQDRDKRQVYNDSGDFDDDDSDVKSWMDYWRGMFRKITTEDIEKFEKEYIGSETELRDIKKAYISGKGDIDHILEMVAFSNCDMIPRFTKIIRKWVDDGEVEEYSSFFKEPKKKTEKRKKKWENDKKEFEKCKVDDADLAKEIELNHQKRQSSFFDLISNLEAKYSNKGTKRKSIKSGENSSPKRKRAPPRPSRK